MSQVNRKNLLEDSFAQVSAMNAGELRRWLRVSYNSLSCSPLFPLTKDEGLWRAKHLQQCSTSRFELTSHTADEVERETDMIPPTKVFWALRDKCLRHERQGYGNPNQKVSSSVFSYLKLPGTAV